MKLQKLYILLFLITSCYTLQGQTAVFSDDVYVEHMEDKKLYDGQIGVRLYTFRQIGDTLSIRMDVNLKNDLIDSRRSLSLVPVLKNEQAKQEYTLPAILINGEKRQRYYERAMKLSGDTSASPYALVIGNTGKDDIKCSYDVKVRFEPWMAQSGFLLKEDFCGCGGHVRQIYVELLAAKIDLEIPEKIDPYLPMMQASFVTPAPEPVKERKFQGQAFLDFPVGSSVIRPNYMNNPRELEKIRQMVQGVISEPGVTVTGIEILGYASPEGTYESNLKLSGNRAQALKNFIKQNYNFSEDIFRVQGKGEDWDGLSKLIAAENELESKEVIQSTIANVDIFAGREKQLMNLSGGRPYRYMLKELFPRLRRSDYTLLCKVAPSTVDEGKKLLKTRPGNLSLNELFLIAQTYETGSADFNDVFDIAVRLYPDDMIANINAAAVALSKKDTGMAKRYLEKYASSKEAFNNLGFLYWLEGNTQQARDFFQKAQANGSKEAEHNLEEIKKAENNQQALKARDEQIKKFNLIRQ